MALQLVVSCYLSEESPLLEAVVKKSLVKSEKT
jgi:hypothetical protein